MRVRSRVLFCSRSPTAEALRRERSQCRCKSCREHHFGPQALIVKQRTFNPWNGEHYPGGPPFPSRLTSRTPDFGSGDRGAEPRSGAISKQTKMPVGVIATRLAYTQESGERNLHGQPFIVRGDQHRNQKRRLSDRLLQSRSAVSRKRRVRGFQASTTGRRRNLGEAISRKRCGSRSAPARRGRIAAKLPV